MHLDNSSQILYSLAALADINRMVMNGNGNARKQPGELQTQRPQKL